VPDTTRRGVVAALLTLAGCAGRSSEDADSTTTDCHLEAESVDHTGVLALANDTSENVTLNVVVRDSGGDAVFANPPGADAGKRTVFFRTDDGGEYTVEYEHESGYGIAEWRVPDSGSTRRLTLVVSATAGGQPTVDTRTSTADPPATRVCE
jgi:hypothetical protein